MNFYGWICAGLFLMELSCWIVVKALQAGASKSPSGLLLMAIYLTLIGHFGISLQNYCCRVARNIEAEDERTQEKKDTSGV
jgi:hypothetical protein